MIADADIIAAAADADIFAAPISMPPCYAAPFRCCSQQAAREMHTAARSSAQQERSARQRAF